ncbi:methyl-CpG-binding domain-containing protein 7-like [Rutidosis leptorrhynchoides]|uniref:methyl-CpG-binding domain-containing protein 7-like n=1 Tax=Rutidosis leptorrhynchoides TaxID=125765 RepID=UPI003A991C23
MRATIHDYQLMDTDDYAVNRQLVPVDVVTPISYDISTSSSITPDHDSVVKKLFPTASKFTLPEGWHVKKVLRKHGDAADKYYRDPKTGRYFRSLKEVERYVTEGVLPSKKRRIIYDENDEKNITDGITHTKLRPRRLTYHRDTENSASRRMIVASDKILALEENKDNQNQLAIVSPASISPRSSFKLPDGWVVEMVPRRTGDHIDRYYYEPGSGQRFRSLVAVQKYLTELEEHSPLSVVLEEIKENHLPLSKAFKLSSCIKKCGSYNSWKKSASRKEKTSIPSKINWVIAGNGAHDWNAFVDETLVQDPVKQQWVNAFMMAIKTKQ